MTGGILSSAAVKAQKLTASVVNSGDVSDDPQNDGEGGDGGEEGLAAKDNVTEKNQMAEKAGALMNSLNLGWSSVKSTVAEKTKASLKQAESVVEKSFESMNKIDNNVSSLVNKTRSSIRKVVNSDAGVGDEGSTAANIEKSVGPTETNESDLILEDKGSGEDLFGSPTEAGKTGSATENLSSGGADDDLFDF